MATTPGTPTNSNGGGYTSDQLVSSFRTMLTHISELLTADNASSLAYIHGLPVPPPGSAPQRPLDVLMELEKRGVFSHENVEPLIGLLTDLHRVDIINTCAIKEYKERAEQARLIRGDSVSSMSSRISGGGPNSRQPSLDQPSQNDPGLSRSIGGSGSKPDIRAGSGMGRGTPDISSSNLLHQLSLQSSSTGSPRAPCSPSSSEEEECLHSMLTSSSPPPPPAADSATPTHQKKHLSEEMTADLIAQLASDPRAVSLMRDVVSRGDVTGSGGQGSGGAAMGSASVRRQIFNVSRNDSSGSMDETRHQSLASATPGQADDLLSPPIEFKSLNPSKTFFQRQTSTSSTQTDEELSLTQAGVIGSIASSRETGSTSGYDSIQTSFTLQGGHNHQSSGSPAIQDDHQSLLSSSPTTTSQATPQPSRDDRGGSTPATPATPTKPVSPQKPPKKQTSKEFDQTVAATKMTWKVKRLQLCEIICKHNLKDLSRDLKLSRKGCRRGGGGDPVKLTFRLYPYGFGRDEGSFMSMRVCVRVDPRMYLRDMATVHLKVTTRFPPGEFVTVRTAANSLEDFVLNDFIPHDIVISETSKTVEFLIEAYLTYDNVTADMPDTKTKELMDSITVVEDGDDDEFMAI